MRACKHRAWLRDRKASPRTSITGIMIRDTQRSIIMSPRARTRRWKNISINNIIMMMINFYGSRRADTDITIIIIILLSSSEAKVHREVTSCTGPKVRSKKRRNRRSRRNNNQEVLPSEVQSLKSRSKPSLPIDAHLSSRRSNSCILNDSKMSHASNLDPSPSTRALALAA